MTADAHVRLDTPLAARLWSGGPVPLVLLHGFLSDGRAWEPLLPALLPRFSVLAIDLPGHGLSAERWSPSGQDDWAWQSRALTDTADAARFDRPLLAGYSMGGRAAAWAIAACPEAWSGALLESAHPGLANPALQVERAKADRQRAERVQALGVEAFAAEWQQLALFASQQHLPEAVRDRQQRLRAEQSAQGLGASLCRYGTGVMPPLPVGGSFRPLCVVAGGHDAAYASALSAWKQCFTNAELVRCEDAGHNIHLEHPDWWLAQLQQLADVAHDRAHDPRHRR